MALAVFLPYITSGGRWNSLSTADEANVYDTLTVAMQEIFSAIAEERATQEHRQLLRAIYRDLLYIAERKESWVPALGGLSFSEPAVDDAFQWMAEATHCWP